MTSTTPYTVARAAGLNLSTAQAAVLKSFYGEALAREELSAFRDVTGTIIAKPRDGGYAELFVESGRRSGKDTIFAACTGVAVALSDPAAWHLAPGETGKIVVLGPTLSHVRQCLDAHEGLFAKLTIPHRRTDLAIELPGRRVEVVAWPADHRLRSMTAVCGIVTESSFLPLDDGSDGHDVEVFAALRPMLITTKGKLVSVSTPWVRAGVHYTTVAAHHGETGGSILAVKGPSWVFNPLISEADTHRAEKDPTRWRREWVGIAGDSEENFLRRGDVLACVDRGVEERAPVKGVRYVVGFDLGLRRDRSAIVVAHRETLSRPQAPAIDAVVVDLVRVFAPDAEHRLDFSSVVTALANISHRYNRATVLRDSFSGDAVHAALKEQGVKSEELPMSAPAQAGRFELLAQKIRSGGLRLLDGRDGQLLVRELVDLRATLHQRGRIEYAAPNKRGAHDDAADALALAVEGSKTLSAVAGDIIVDRHMNWGEGGLSVDVRYRNKKTGMPCGPPIGSAAWRALREQQAAEGITVLDDLNEFNAAIGVNRNVEGE